MVNNEQIYIEDMLHTMTLIIIQNDSYQFFIKIYDAKMKTIFMGTSLGKNGKIIQIHFIL